MEEIYVVIPSNDLQKTISKLEFLNLKYRVGSEDWLDEEISKRNYSILYSNIVNPQFVEKLPSEFSEYEDSNLTMGSSSSKSKSKSIPIDKVISLEPDFRAIENEKKLLHT